ncbi:hypothetical protein RRG08_054932 [Elysia crispata]|uniref:Apple domain-containing protein n=1 Tax=Elysia crispata TaxID=231223 RepID=A0AAE1D752_9GAST|nr:hypothetical protein RRG08_054932 [Elysia crispata]
MLYFLLFCALLRLTDGLNVTSHRFRIQKHTKLTSGVTKIRDVSRRDMTILVCAAQCGSEDQCNMFDFNERQNSCTLFSQTIFDPGVLRSPSPEYHLGFRIDFDNITSAGWTLVFKAHKLINSSVYNAWTNSDQVHDHPLLPGFPFECLSLGYVDTSCAGNQHFRSLILNEWRHTDVDRVWFSLKTGSTQVAFIEFDGLGSDRDTWFTESRVLNSTWGPYLSSVQHMGISGYFTSATARRFNVFGPLTGCVDEWLYTTVVDQMQDECNNQWDLPTGTGFPVFLYSRSGKASTSRASVHTYDLAQAADALEVWIKLFD